MFRNRILSRIVFLSMVVWGSGIALGEIVWVSDATSLTGREANDQGFVDLLEKAGYEVTRADGTLHGKLTEEKVAALDQVDLIIVSRDTYSRHYRDSAGWNSIKTPIVLLSPWLAKRDGWCWFDTSTVGDQRKGRFCGNGGTPKMKVVVPKHAAFDDLNVKKGQSMAIVDAETSFTNVPNAGHGTTLAVTDNLNAVWMAYWEPGTEFFDESDQVPAGPRLYLSAGQYGVSKFLDGDTPVGRVNLLPDGQTLFLNVVKFMIIDRNAVDVESRRTILTAPE